MSAEVKHLPNTIRRAPLELEGQAEKRLKDAQLKSKRFNRLLCFGLLLVTIGWLGVSGYYLHNFMEWAFLAALLPHELAGLVAGIFMPIAFIWLMGAFFRRGQSLELYTNELRHQLALLTYPTDQENERSQTVANMLRRQTEELTNATKAAAAEITELTAMLDERTGALNNASFSAREDAGNLRHALAGQTEKLEKLTDRMDLQRKMIEETVDTQVEQLDRAATEAREKTENLRDILQSQTDEVTQVTNNASEQADIIVQKFESQTINLQKMAQNAHETSKDMTVLFDRSTDFLNQATEAAALRSNDIAQKLREVVHSMDQRMKESFEQHKSSLHNFSESSAERLTRLTQVLRQQTDLTLEQVENGFERFDKDLNRLFDGARKDAQKMGDDFKFNIETLSQKLDVVIDEQTSRLGDVMHKSNEHIQEISLALREQTANLHNSVDQSGTRVEAIKAAIAEQSQELVKLSGQLAADVKQVNERVDKHTGALGRISDEAAYQVDEMGENLRKQAQEIARATDIAASRTEALKDMLRLQSDELADAAQKTYAQTKTMEAIVQTRTHELREMLGEGVDYLEGSFQPVVERTQQVVTALKKNGNIIRQTSDWAGEQAQNIHNALQGQSQELQRATEAAAGQLDLLRGLMATHTGEMNEASDYAQNQAIRIKDALRGEAHLLSELALSLSHQAGLIEETVGKQTQDLHVASDHAAETTRNIQNNVAEQILALKNMSDRVDENLQKANAIFKNESHAFNDVMVDSFETFEALTDKFQNQRELLASTATQTILQLGESREGLRENATELASVAREAVQSMQNMGAHFTHQSKAIEQGTESLKDRVDALSSGLSKQSQQISTIGDIAEEKMSRISDILALQATALSETTQASKAAMDEASLAAKESAKFLSDAVDRTAHRTKQSIQLMDSESNKLIRAAEEAVIMSEKTKKAADDNSREAFVKTTRYILEDLNSTSVDLTRILRADVPETDWKRYTNGDRGVFTRALLRERPHTLLNQISDRMKEDAEARSYFSRYLEQFDRLLQECRQSDPENLMESTVLSSDVGKLYSLIKQAMR